MCNIYEVLDKLTGIFSLDWGLLAEQVTNIAVYMGMEAMDMLEDIANNMGEDCLGDAIELANDVTNELL